MGPLMPSEWIHLNYRLAVLEKITALGEASKFMADYINSSAFYFSIYFGLNSGSDLYAGGFSNYIQRKEVIRKGSAEP
jgi:hypothetical protein